MTAVSLFKVTVVTLVYIDQKRNIGIERRLGGLISHQKIGSEEMLDFIILGILVIIVGAAILYIRKEKKKGVRCIGCPAAGNCPHGGKCSGGAK